MKSNDRTMYEDDGRIIRFHVPYGQTYTDAVNWLHDNLGSRYSPNFNVGTVDGIQNCLWQMWEDIMFNSQEGLHKAFLRSTRAWMSFESSQAGGWIVWLKPTTKKRMMYFKLAFHKA